MSDAPFSLEEKLGRLREIVAQMQQGISDFDQQMKLFQEGTTLVNSCREFLDKTETSVQQLIKGEITDFPHTGL
ncbi:MAG: exodeoxyribonuclease VII small subunit [Bacteroidota bacterium]